MLTLCISSFLVLTLLIRVVLVFARWDGRFRDMVPVTHQENKPKISLNPHASPHSRPVIQTAFFFPPQSCTPSQPQSITHARICIRTAPSPNPSPMHLRPHRTGGFTVPIHSYTLKVSTTTGLCRGSAWLLARALVHTYH